MNKIYIGKKPSVNSTTWTRMFHSDGVSVYDSDKYQDFYKVVPQDDRPRYFFGEQAWMDCQRFVVDKVGHSGYNIFS